jgi:UDP-N-acetylmuramate: L-alanyl-gamma-D-glutamyl-meso-diaminopimelate ligase
MNPGFLIGGIAENLKTSCADGSGDFFITEGDEYDTAFFDKRSKFFHYLPDQLVLNNLEFDHADIFASLEQIQQSFRWLLRLVPGNGLVVVNGDDDNLKPVLEQIYSPLLTFGLGPDCNVRIEDIQSVRQVLSFGWKALVKILNKSGICRWQAFTTFVTPRLSFYWLSTTI